MDFMDKPTGTWLGFINTLYWIGAGTTAFAAAWCSNRFGRKPVIWMGFACLLSGTVIQAASPNRDAFMVGRLLTGMSMGFMNNAGPSLIAEVAYPTHQGVATALYMTSYYVGSIVAAWVTFGTRNMASDWAWRIPTLFQLLMPGLAIPGFLWISESPRWLVSVKKIEKARLALARLHADGMINVPLVDEELDVIKTSIEAEAEAEQGSGYSEMLRTRGNRHRLLISVTLGFFDQWAGNGLLSYYLTIVLNTIGITSTSSQLLISACLQMWNLPLSLAGAISVDRIGRRTLFLLSAFIMLVSYVIMTALYGSFVTTGNSATGISFIPFVFVYFAGYDIAL